MTKKDYELIAQSFSLFSRMYAEELESDNTPEEQARIEGALRGIQLVANSLASQLSTNNSRFQGVKFLKACNVERDERFLIFSN